MDYRKLTTFRGVVRFEDLPTRTKRIYTEIKKNKRTELYQKEKIEENPVKVPVDVLLQALKDGKVANKEEFEKLGGILKLIPLNAFSGIRTRLRKEGDKRNAKDFFTDIIKVKEEKERKKNEKVSLAEIIPYLN